MKWRLKNPVVPIQVMQLNRNNLDEVCDFINIHDWDVGERNHEDCRIIVEDDGGDIHYMQCGDYAVYYTQSDNFAVFKKDKFESIYEPIK